MSRKFFSSHVPNCCVPNPARYRAGRLVWSGYNACKGIADYASCHCRRIFAVKCDRYPRRLSEVFCRISRRCTSRDWTCCHQTKLDDNFPCKSPPKIYRRMFGVSLIAKTERKILCRKSQLSPALRGKTAHTCRNFFCRKVTKFTGLCGTKVQVARKESVTLSTPIKLLCTTAT